MESSYLPHTDGPPLEGAEGLLEAAAGAEAPVALGSACLRIA